MRKLLFTLSLCALLPTGCDGSGGTGAGMDASGMDLDGGGAGDAGGDPDGGPGPDGGAMEPDADVATCGAGQHLCGATCTDPMPDLPANGCRLGCGEPCPGGADAICTEDGTCGLLDCSPTTCDGLGASCGTVDDGCGHRISCGTCEEGLVCADNQCLCMGDPHEENGTTGTATSLGTLSDGDDATRSVTTGTLHTATDDDWYRLEVENAVDFGDPVITVTLTDLPAGEDYDLGAWYDCPDGDTPTCTSGESDSSTASGGCISFESGDDTVSFDTNCDPNGVLFVHVRSPFGGGSCEPYRLDITVE
jgi:hypothetical protein